MSEILQMHFSDLDDIKFEEFYDFFCTDVSNKTKNNLYEAFLKIKGDKDEVSFEDIARFYCEDYEELVSILDFLTNASEKLEEIYSKKDILNDEFLPNMIEKIVYYDIESRIRSFHGSLSNITKILDGNIKKIKKESELEAKIKDILKAFKQSPSNFGGQEVSAYERAPGFSKIDELQAKLNDFQREIDNLKGGFIQQSGNYYEEKETFNHKGNKGSDPWSYEKINMTAKSEFLTGHVWPKSRMLLAIVSKMSKEGLLNLQQKGVLKDLIIDDDPRIAQCLRQYELDGNRKMLYRNCLNLAMRAKNEF